MAITDVRVHIVSQSTQSNVRTRRLLHTEESMAAGLHTGIHCSYDQGILVSTARMIKVYWCPLLSYDQGIRVSTARMIKVYWYSLPI